MGLLPARANFELFAGNQKEAIFLSLVMYLEKGRKLLGQCIHSKMSLYISESAL